MKSNSIMKQAQDEKKELLTDIETTRELLRSKERELFHAEAQQKITMERMEEIEAQASKIEEEARADWDSEKRKL